MAAHNVPTHTGCPRRAHTRSPHRDTEGRRARAQAPAAAAALFRIYLALNEYRILPSPIALALKSTCVRFDSRLGLSGVAESYAACDRLRLSYSAASVTFAATIKIKLSRERERGREPREIAYLAQGVIKKPAPLLRGPARIINFRRSHYITWE